jgi:flagellar assembly factor FliW
VTHLITEVPTDAVPSEPDDRDDPLDGLHSLDDPGLRFVVVPPATFFADYAPEIDDSVVTELGVESDDDVLALVVVTLGACRY